MVAPPGQTPTELTGAALVHREPELSRMLVVVAKPMAKGAFLYDMRAATAASACMCVPVCAYMCVCVYVHPHLSTFFFAFSCIPSNCLFFVHVPDALSPPVS